MAIHLLSHAERPESLDVDALIFPAVFVFFGFDIVETSVDDVACETG